MKKALKYFLKEYEIKTNTHDFKKVKPLIASNATYWFSDGTFKGISAIEKAFTRTWQKIQNETYQIKNVEWLAISDKMAVCIYDFHWRGKVDGKWKKGRGRGTNVIVKRGKYLQMLHEHLSTY